MVVVGVLVVLGVLAVGPGWRNAVARSRTTSAPVSAALLSHFHVPPRPPPPEPPSSSPTSRTTPRIPPVRTAFTAFTSTTRIRLKEAVALRSWLASGASRVIYFVDDAAGQGHADANEFSFVDWSRVALRDNPHPRSPETGKARIDLIIQHAEREADTEWLLLLNSDIVMSPRIATIPRFLERNGTLVASGMRINCHIHSRDALLAVTSVEDLEAAAVTSCEPYNAGAMDYFLYKRGAWATLLNESRIAQPHPMVLAAHASFSASSNRSSTNNGFVAEPLNALAFYIGTGYWDNSLMHIAKPRAVDVSGVFLAGHIVLSPSAGDDAAAKLRGWDYSVGRDKRDFRRNYTVMPDMIWNAILRCHINHRLPSINCFVRGSLRYAKFALCTDGSLAVVDRFVHDAGVFLLKRNVTQHFSERCFTSFFVNGGGLASGLGCSPSSEWTDALDPFRGVSDSTRASLGPSFATSPAYRWCRLLSDPLGDGGGA